MENKKMEEFPADDLPLVEEPSEKSETSCTGETVSYEEVCCPDYDMYQDNKECDLNFDYNQYKAMMVKRFASDLKATKKKKSKKSVCLLKERSEEVSIDKSNEWYKALTLIGETEKGHQASVSCFLKNRKKALLKICNDDPEFAKIMLGCPLN